MQQNNEGRQKILKSVSLQKEYVNSFVQFFQKMQVFIENDLTNLLTSGSSGLGHAKYPVKCLKFRKAKYPKQVEYGTLFEIRTKIEQRILYQNLSSPSELICPDSNKLISSASSLQMPHQNSHKINEQFQEKKISDQNLLILSDLLIWSIPNLCSNYMGMMNYIKKWKNQHLLNMTKEQQIQKNQFCKKLLSNISSNIHSTLLEKNQISEINLLRLPLLIICDYFQKWQEMIQYYELKEEFFKQKLPQKLEQQNLEGQIINQQTKMLEKLIDLANHQKTQIKNRVKQAQKYIQDIDSVQSLDPEVYKNRLIISQYKPLLNPKNKYLYRYGKRLCFITTLKKCAKKAEKHTRERKEAIFQLIDKEKIYIDCLTQFIDYIKNPIQRLKILSQNQERLIFCNIGQIKKFHEELYQCLVKRYEQHHKYQTYGDIIKGVIPFFKLYIDYIYQAENAQNLLIKLNSENEEIKGICEKYFIDKYKTAAHELMQPTFKIARYEMMFDQIIKKSNPSTADYKLFSDAKQLFKHKLREVNDTVDKIVRRNKLNQLEQQFGTLQQPLMKLDCEYLSQFNLIMIYQQKNLNVVLFAFTDVILIAEEITRKKLKYIQVDQKFYVRREDDSKIYRNVIKIHSTEGYVTLSTGNDDKNLKKAEEMFQLLKNIQKTTESKELIYIQVLGTEEIGSTSFAKYTEYIIEIKFITLKKLLHLRFSQVANIVKVMQNFYKDSLGITEEETLKKTWFNNHKSKTIQDRKRTIEQILQKLFNHQKIKLHPMFLLNYLNLPQNFFQIAKKLSAQKINLVGQSSIFLKKEVSSGEDRGISKVIQKQLLQGLRISEFTLSTLQKGENQLSKKELKEAFTLLCATEIKLGRDIYHDSDLKLQSRKQKADKIQIYIHTMGTNELKMVRVTEFDSVQDVCNMLSKLLGLRSNRDFRLFHEIGKKELRVLEHQQLILKIFSFPRPKKVSSSNNMASLVNNVSNMMQSMASSLVKVISPETHPILIFKKYYFLPFQIEARQSKKDLTRLRLLTYQVFAQVKEMKYQLNFEEYLIFTALLIYIEMDGDIDLQKIQPSIIQRIIPETIFKLKNYSEEEWLKKVQPHLLKYQQEIKKVIDYNELQMKQNKIKTDIPLKMALHFGHRHLASQIVLNRIKSNPIYGSNLFYVQPYKKTYEELKQDSLKMAYNMWLAVKVDSISLLTPSSKESQFQLKYTDIQKINVYSEAIVFKTDDLLNKQYRLNTYQSFQISQLVKYYKILNEIMKELGDDQKLSNQVKKYRSEIERYRSTYQNHYDNENQFQIDIYPH